MEKPIDDSLEEAGIPKCGPSTIKRITLASRERHGLPRGDKSHSDNSAIREGIIVVHIEHHPTLLANQMVQPIQNFLASTVVLIRAIKRYLTEEAGGAQSDDPDVIDDEGPPIPSCNVAV